MEWVLLIWEWSKGHLFDHRISLIFATWWDEIYTFAKHHFLFTTSFWRVIFIFMIYTSRDIVMSSFGLRFLFICKTILRSVTYAPLTCFQTFFLIYIYNSFSLVLLIETKGTTLTTWIPKFFSDVMSTAMSCCLCWSYLNMEPFSKWV